MARVKQDLYLDLERAEFLKGQTAKHIYPTLRTAIKGYTHSGASAWGVIAAFKQRKLYNTEAIAKQKSNKS